MMVDKDIYIGRELSWLKFNERVLSEADSPTVPLLERLKFLSIFTSNLDEFFMVRVGTLDAREGVSDTMLDNKTQLSPGEELDLLCRESERLYAARDGVFSRLVAELSQSGVRRLCWNELTKEQKRSVRRYFRKELAIFTSPYIINSHTPFPHLENNIIHVLLTLRDKAGNSSIGIVPLPPSAKGYYVIEKGCDSLDFIISEEIMLHCCAELFSEYKVKGAMLFKVTRNADIEYQDGLSDESEPTPDYPTYLKIQLKKREKLGAVKLEYFLSGAGDGLSTSDRWALDFILSKLSLPKSRCYRSFSPLGYNFASSLWDEAAEIIPNGLYKKITPIYTKREGILNKLDSSDILLSFPYHDFREYLDFLREAVYDKRTRSIKITLYRLAKHSQVISLLCDAASRGIKVTAVVELKARFDEENNIHLAELLEEAGCSVIYGMSGLKVHSKLTLAVLDDSERELRYAHIATGNYNEQTAKLYTDLALLTSDEAITADASELFCAIESGKLCKNYRELLVSPTTLREGIIREIKREKRRAERFGKGYICFKMNSLTDKTVIDALIDASCAGVKIDLIIRGICCLAPQIPGKTENIRVISIVGRYLEHSRIYIFGQPTKGEPSRIYIGSADMMTRNTTRRIEVLTPIKSPKAALKLYNITRFELLDNVKSSELDQDGSYKKTESNGKPFDSQMELFRLQDGQ